MSLLLALLLKTSPMETRLLRSWSCSKPIVWLGKAGLFHRGSFSLFLYTKGVILQFLFFQLAFLTKFHPFLLGVYHNLRRDKVFIYFYFIFNILMLKKVFSTANGFLNLLLPFHALYLFQVYLNPLSINTIVPNS